jgi:hypothetical protein
MDLYTYLLKNIEKKTKVVIDNYKFYIKKEKLTFFIDSWADIIIYKNESYSFIKCYEKEYLEDNFKTFLDLVDTINKYYFLNYSIIQDNLIFHGIDFMTINTLSGIKNPYLDYGFKSLQNNFPRSDNLDIIKSNAYYYDKYFKENIELIINFKMDIFIKFLKKVFKKEFYQKKHLRDIEELKKFDYTLKDFMVEKANLKKIKCFEFFYKNMEHILNDLSLLPKKYIIFY